MKQKKISALFSTFNRSELLNKALTGLLTQTLPREYFEVIIIDDGSIDNTRDISSQYIQKLDLRYVFQKHSGIAEGKNHALHLAQAPIVIFMDDDDVAEENLLEQHLLTHDRYPKPNMAVLGLTKLHQDIAEIPIMHFITQVGEQLFSYKSLNHGQILNYEYFWGGRSSCKRCFLQKHGIFNPIFKFGCEDIELGYRLSKYNLRVIYNKKAITKMLREITLNDFCHRVEQQGNSNWLFSRLHPYPEIQLWANVLNIDNRWNDIRVYFDHYKKSASDLDRIARARISNKIKIDKMLQDLLHKFYWLTIDSHRLRGTWTSYQKELAITGGLPNTAQPYTQGE